MLSLPLLLPCSLRWIVLTWAAQTQNTEFFVLPSKKKKYTWPQFVQVKRRYFTVTSATDVVGSCDIHFKQKGHRHCMCIICNPLQNLPNTRFQMMLPQPELSSATSVLSRHSMESSVDLLHLCHIFGSKVLKIKAQAQEISPDITMCICSSHSIFQHIE